MVADKAARCTSDTVQHNRHIYEAEVADRSVGAGFDANRWLLVVMQSPFRVDATSIEGLQYGNRCDLHANPGTPEGSRGLS